MADDDGNTGGTTTFTQADVNRLIAEERRRTEARFSDYNDLKKKAEESQKAADSQKSDIDKLTAAVTALTERATKSEAQLARGEAAKKHKLPDWVVGKLTSTTPEDAEREAKEWHDQLKSTGWNPDGGKQGGDGDGAGAGDGDGKTGGGAGSNGTGGAGSNGTGGSAGQGGAAGNGGGRPREDLRDGTAGAGGGGQQEDVKKAADSILSAGMY